MNNTCFSIFGILYIFMHTEAPFIAYVFLFVMVFIDIILAALRGFR